MCEFSGVVREEFKKLGHDAWSCDLLPSEIDGKHFQCDIFQVIDSDWDLIIAHPPCTAISVSGNRYYANTQARLDGIKFVEDIWFESHNAKLCIENPVGVLVTMSRLPVKPQYIQPHWFGHPESKKTGLWLRGLPNLIPTNKLDLPECGYWDNQTPSKQNKLGPSETRWMERSRTYKGIAEAMAKQFTEYINGTKKMSTL